MIVLKVSESDLAPGPGHCPSLRPVRHCRPAGAPPEGRQCHPHGARSGRGGKKINPSVKCLIEFLYRSLNVWDSQKCCTVCLSRLSNFGAQPSLTLSPAVSRRGGLSSRLGSSCPVSGPGWDQTNGLGSALILSLSTLKKTTTVNCR